VGDRYQRRSHDDANDENLVLSTLAPGGFVPDHTVEQLAVALSWMRPRKSGSQQTPRWRKTDSNSRSLREGKGCGQLLQASIAVSDLNL
jgi:hypothetical protein